MAAGWQERQDLAVSSTTPTGGDDLSEVTFGHYGTGHGEVVAMEWCHVDLSKGIYHLTRRISMAWRVMLHCRSIPALTKSSREIADLTLR